MWMPKIRRHVNNWEMGELCNLLGILNGTRPMLNSSDVMMWRPSSKGRFSTKSLYHELIRNEAVSFPF